MPVIDKIYAEISLADEHLKDPLLMALAWKKSHQYIRTTNWYADNFELDLSTLNLIKHCENWVGKLDSKLCFSDLKLVPAPKASTWEFIKNPKIDVSKPKKVVSLIAYGSQSLMAQHKKTRITNAVPDGCLS